ncbi:hypothetical protein AU255_09085 [Methyloprofundus sedimenti]|uniref:Uncharacterized protein n=1 Tax=Methyloprofundus sedimenti TaxID=1420851 RepID=A0A1V8M9L8_9GAMM|nr:hypothetical protein [Methyloprofundus sedimenti]OQK17993.1 hypothetical protein AU255_09085 [Methyloprofundus sedimenti]
MIEIGVILAVIVAAWFYLRVKKEKQGSVTQSATMQTVTPKPKVMQEQEPEPVKAKPVETKKVSKPAIVIPEDSMLRRHYMQNLTATKECRETPFPEDSTLRRHYLQNLAAQQDKNVISKADSKVAAAEDLIIPASKKTNIPEEAELKRDVIQQLVAETEATMPPRPTDSTLKRHYDTQLMSVVLSKLQASK